MGEKRQKVLLVRNAPGTPEAVGALCLAQALHARGHSLTLALVQDAVLCAISASRLESARDLQTLVGKGVPCHYLAADLAMRGYAPGDVLPGCKPLDYEGMADLLLAEGASVAGAF